MAAIGAVIARGEHHRRAFDMVRPGIDLDAEIAKRRAAGSLYHFARADLYPDAVPCLEALRAASITFTRIASAVLSRFWSSPSSMVRPAGLKSSG
jgi:hypothetical protein